MACAMKCDWLIDHIVFYAESTIFRPYYGGPWSVKLRLGIYKVFWYCQHYVVWGVNHVLTLKEAW